MTSSSYILPIRRKTPESNKSLQITLGPAVIATQGQAAVEVAQTYARARGLCEQVGDSPHLFPVLQGLLAFYMGRAEYQTAQEIGTHLFRLAQRLDDPVARLHAHGMLGIIALYLGDFAPSRVHLEQGIALADHLEYCPPALTSPWDFEVVCRIGVASVLQQLGYPDQAHQRSQEALAHTQRLTSPFNRCNLLFFLALFHLFRREWSMAQQRVEESLRLAMAHGFPLYAALGTIVWGTTLVAQEQGQDGVAHIRQGLEAWHTTGAKVLHPWGLAMLAEGYGHVGQPEAGLQALAETHALIATTREECYAAEIARLQGALLLQAGRQAPDVGVGTLPAAAAAETCFQHALQVARRQQARWWELRAAISLARLWQQQGKRQEAYNLLAPIYGWFTEGFHTADLQEAKTLLEELGG